MQLNCTACGALLEYTRQPPRFCSECGSRVPSPAEQAPDAYPRPDSTRQYDSPSPAHAGSFGEPPPAPETVGGYRILRPIGAGGMGAVYEGVEEGSGRRVAVKLIRPEFA